ncbi:MAG: leucine-rich repeat domain-containing protein [Lachnospiraceae bacterium]|nr:leucine-rich repeat domain-containing protein [Lachnospiraceae bacterium]
MKKNNVPQFNVRRELVKLECQDCGADLEMLDEIYAHCKYCGQKYIVNVLLERIPDATAEREPQTVKTQVTKSQTTKSQTSSVKNQSTFWAIGLIAIVVLMLLGSFRIFQNEQKKPDLPKKDWEWSDDYVEDSREKEDKDDYIPTKGESIEKWDGFRSETMKQVIYIMFGKPASEVTKEELESIKYFKIDGLFWENCTISYSTEDYRDYEADYREKLQDYNGEILFGYNKAFEETIQKITIPYPSESFALINGDIRNFTNLTSICLRDYGDMDFSAMPHLTMVDCGSDLKEVLETNLPLEQIETLIVADCDLAGLPRFTSLKHLFLEGIEEDGMYYVEKCSTLETLFCNYCFGTASYAPLGQLTGLKSLYIDGGYDAVKDLSMISSMTELENLSITCTDILNIGFVKDLKKLKTLRLSENGELRDFEGIGTLQELEFLELNINSLSGGQPEYAEIGELKNLKSLALHTVYNLDFLYELKQLEKLEVRLTFYDDVLLPIAQMKNLKELTLAQTNTWGIDMEQFKGLQELPKLKKLTINRMDFEEPVDELFAIDGLEELRITSCGFEYLPAKITVSDNLKVLDLSSTYFGDYYNGGPQEEQEVLNRYCEATTLEKLDLTYYDVTDLSVFENLSNLKELSLYSCELTNIPATTFSGCDSLERLVLSNNQIADISFVKNLPNLKFLELREGYVTDLSPLSACPKLRCVDVRANPIAANPLTNVVVIIE